MKYLSKAFVILTLLTAFTACDDSTDGMGTSLISDHMSITTAQFDVSSRSVKVDSVLSRNTTAYLGRVKDPETGAYITGSSMLQFGTLEDYAYPSKDSLVTINGKDTVYGQIKADSCEIHLYYESFYGDSLSPMKLTLEELSKPMEEDRNYYSEFDPETNGYVRNDGKGIKVNKTYTLTDLTTNKSIRQSSSYLPNITIRLNEPYTDRDGKVYNNLGTYLMQKYYENPSNYKSSYELIHKLLPGFWVKYNSGYGSMAYISYSMLAIYYNYFDHDADSVVSGATVLPGTESVLQTTKISNDEDAINKMINDNTCTYVKTPAGIFTELTLPVNDIMSGHENDSINGAKIVLHRLASQVSGDYSLPAPSTLLMIPEDSLYSFFIHKDVANYQTSYLASWGYSPHAKSPTYSDSYTFDNISGLITAMYKAKNKSDNWNKVVVIPVSVQYSSTGVLTQVTHNMALTSAKLAGGSKNPNTPLTVSVIYSKFTK